MSRSQQIISAAVLFAGVFAVSQPALADWRDRNQRRAYREDLRDLRNAQRELRRDLRHGAGPEEIARDRAAIARERRELRQYRFGRDDRHGWRRYGRYRDHDRNDRWDRRDYRRRNWAWWR
jgi:hypothetical protein